jgi:hypothetical protein
MIIWRLEARSTSGKLESGPNPSAAAQAVFRQLAQRGHTVRAVVAAAVLLPLVGCASLPNEIRAEEVTYQVVAAVDAMQTMRTADTPGRLHEDNPLLGPHPSPGKVAVYFAVGAVAHYGITSLLVEHDAPPWLVRAWELSGITMEVACVGNNLGDGIAPTLSFHVKR